MAASKRGGRMVFNEPYVVGWGGNSGFQAINLVFHFGVRKIVLVGFDMHADHGLHWHGRHPPKMNNPSRRGLARWGRTLDVAAVDLARHGVTVINASEASALTAYPKMSLGGAIECLSATNIGA